MKDGKITKKGPNKSYPLGSFAFRIVIICFCLLIFPLVFHTFFLYQQEEEQKIEEVQEILEFAASAQKDLIDARIEGIWLLLEAQSQKFQSAVLEIPLPQGAGKRFALGAERGMLVGVQQEQNRALATLLPFDAVLQEPSNHFPFSFHLALVSPKGQTLAGSLSADALKASEPLRSAPFSIVAAASSSSIQGIHEREVLFRFGTFILFVGFIGGLAVWVFTRRMARPLKELCQTMQKVSEGATHARYTPDRMGFEINDLGKEFNRTLDSLLWHQQEIDRERMEREKLAQELRIGHEIQSSLLPTNIPEIEGIEIAPGYLPSREVGGDFYDLFPLENGKLFLTIADTAGKGISACLYSLGIRSSMRSFAVSQQSLSETMIRANDLFLIDAKNTGMFVTVWAALYDPKTKIMTYCNQGHAPALLIREGKVQELTTHGIALGAHKMIETQTKEIQLEPGDLLFLYTDGIIEAHDPDQQLFGSKRLREFLLRNQKRAPSKIVDQIIEEIHLFGQGAPQHDDLTVLAIRF